MKKSLLRGKIFILLPLLISLIAASFFFPPENVTAREETQVQQPKATYQKVEKIIDISNSKVCLVTTNITVTFNEDYIRGIIITLPRANTVTRVVDGKTYTVKTLTKLSLISVVRDGKPEYGEVDLNNMQVFHIETGTGGKYLRGEHVYQIQYSLDLGEDYIKEFDDFTFDILEDNYAGGVKDFSAHIKLPKDTTTDNLTFYRKGRTPLLKEEAEIEASQSDIVISMKNVAPKNGVTMQLILPQGYFATSSSVSIGYMFAVAISMVCILLMLTIFIALRIRHKSKVFPIVEFYPPNNFSPTDVAKALRGYVRSKDLAALVISWADKGFLTIERDGKKDLRLIKKREMTARPSNKRSRKSIEYRESSYTKYEKAYFDRIFANGDFFTKKTKNGGNYFVKSAANDVALCTAEETPFEKKNIFFVLLHMFLSLAPSLVLVIWAVSLSGAYVLFMIVLFMLAGTAIALEHRIPLWGKLLFFITFNAAPIIALVLSVYCGAYDSFYLLYIAVAANIIGNAILVNFVEYRKEENFAILGKLEGFKHFLLTAEIAKLEMLVEQSPSYFYDILPYCYVFNITKKMRKKFKLLSGSVAPDWYDDNIGGNSFSSSFTSSLSLFSGNSKKE